MVTSAAPPLVDELAGTFDSDFHPRARVLRLKAIVLAVSKYRLLVQRDRRCGCLSCEARLALDQENGGRL